MVRSIWDEDEDEESEEQKSEEDPEADDESEITFGDGPIREPDYEKEFEEASVSFAEGFSIGEGTADDELGEDESEEEEVEEDSLEEEGNEGEEESYVDDQGGTDDNSDGEGGFEWESFKAEFGSEVDDDAWVEKPPPPIPVLGEAIFFVQNACRAYSLLVNVADKGLKLSYRYIKGKITDYMEDPYGEDEEEEEEEETPDEYPRL